MEELDALEHESLRVEVFYHLAFSKKLEPSADVINKVLETYNAMTQCPTERMLDSIDYYRQSIAKKYGHKIPDITPTVYFSNVMWEYLYVLSYYLNHNDYYWKKHFLPRMKELARNNTVKDDMAKAEKLVDAYINKRIELERDLDTHYADLPEDTKEIEKLHQQIKELQEQLAQKEAVIAEKEAKIKELETPNAQRLSFVKIEGRQPQEVNNVLEDVYKAIGSPAEMADCLIALQAQNFLKNQERYGKIKRIKKIHDELKKAYHITWTYEALVRAINRRKSAH